MSTKAVAVCTPSAGSGCTFVSLNLAIAMAQIGVRVALVDADLRNASISDEISFSEPRYGLADHLADEAVRLQDIVHSDVMPRLSVITAGTIPANPQELLSGKRFRAFVDQLLREFDLTILDTTPANSCFDAQRVATVAGYSLIVARKHKSYVNDVATLAKLLRADRSAIVGTVLNDF